MIRPRARQLTHVSPSDLLQWRVAIAPRVVPERRPVGLRSGGYRERAEYEEQSTGSHQDYFIIESEGSRHGRLRWGATVSS